LRIDTLGVDDRVGMRGATDGEHGRHEGQKVSQVCPHGGLSWSLSGSGFYEAGVNPG
jgi:hypothetical protein